MTYQLAEPVVVETPPIRVFPASERSHLTAPHDRYVFPRIFVTTVRDAIVYGSTNLVLTGDRVICHDLYDFERDYTSEELHGRAIIDAKNSRIRWLDYDPAPAVLPSGAQFMDACASNYAHWVSEVLPRIAVFCSDDRFRDVPIVVNDGLHPNILESLYLLAGARREVIALPLGMAISFGLLYVTAATGYVPFGRRRNKLDGHSHGAFNPTVFQVVRDAFREFGIQKPDRTTARRIYLRRNSGTRRLVNNQEIERVLVERGFSIVEPERLTFADQLSIFRWADMVIGTTGAACANIVFCRPGARTAILMGKHRDMPYRYWANMAGPLGIEVSCVLGARTRSSRLGIHSDFRVDPRDVIDFVDSATSP